MTRHSFKYDPFGRRVYESSPAGTSVYVYDGNNMTQELNGIGSAVAVYTRGSWIDEPLAVYGGATTSYFQADGLGSVTSLTDPPGVVAASYVYDSFGNLTASTGTVTNPYRYTGREFDPETSLYYYRARYYDSVSGRFLSEDPTGFKGSGSNFYIYVGNSPIDLVDALGLCATKEATAKCIQKALESLFPGANVTV
jgi:RHS repeat-associated protein